MFFHHPLAGGAVSRWAKLTGEFLVGPTKVAGHHPHPRCLETYAAGDWGLSRDVSAGDRTSDRSGVASVHHHHHHHHHRPFPYPLINHYHHHHHNHHHFPYTLFKLSSVGYTPCSDTAAYFSSGTRVNWQIHTEEKENMRNIDILSHLMVDHGGDTTMYFSQV